MRESRSGFRVRLLAVCAALGLALGGVALTAGPAAAVPALIWVENTSDDVLVANSLPWAIAQANNNGNPGEIDQIQFRNIVYPTTIAVILAPLPTILDNVEITGPGPTNLTVSITPGSAFVATAPATDVAITGLTIITNVVGSDGIDIGDEVAFTGSDLFINAVDADVTSFGGSLDLSNSDFRGAEFGVYWLGNDADDTAVLDAVNCDANNVGAYIGALAGSTGTVTDSGFDGNVLYGLFAGSEDAGSLIFDGADAYDNGSVGIYVSTSTDGTADVSNSFVEANPVGMNFSVSGTSVVTGTGNSVEGAGDASPDVGIGVVASGSAQVTLTATRARLNDTGVSISSAGSAQVTFDGASAFSDNSSATTGGGAVIIAAGTSTVEFDGATFEFNNGLGGAGAYVQSISGDADVIFQNSTIQNNTAGNDGGGIAVASVVGATSTFQLLDSEVRGNTSNGGYGGGLYFGTIGDGTGGTASIVRSTIDGNDAPAADSFGGGIFINNLEQDSAVTDAAFLIQDSTVSRNTATGDGGGLFIYTDSEPAIAEINNSTFSGNEAAVASAIYFDGDFAGDVLLTTLRLLHSTISAVGTAGQPSIDYDEAGYLEIGNTILTSDTGYDLAIDNPDDAAIDARYSIIGAPVPGLEPFLAGPGMQFGVNPLLGPLEYNGGPNPTQTHLLLAGSPAIDKGGPAFPPVPATDQRGLPRVVNGIIDIGAVEVPFVLPATGGAAAGWPLAAVLLLLAGTGLVVVRRFVLH